MFSSSLTSNPLKCKNRDRISRNLRQICYLILSTTRDSVTINALAKYKCINLSFNILLTVTWDQQRFGNKVEFCHPNWDKVLLKTHSEWIGLIFKFVSHCSVLLQLQ